MMDKDFIDPCRKIHKLPGNIVKIQLHLYIKVMYILCINTQNSVIYIILKWAILHNEHYFWLFQYILMLILLYLYLSNILSAGFLLATKYFCSVVLLLLLQDLSTCSTAEATSSKTNILLSEDVGVGFIGTQTKFFGYQT